MIVKLFVVKVAIADKDREAYSEEVLSQSVLEALDGCTVAAVDAATFHVEQTQIEDPDPGDYEDEQAWSRAMDEWNELGAKLLKGARL